MSDTTTETGAETATAGESEAKPDFVLVLHENGIVAPVGRVFAETYKLNIVEGDALDLRGRPVAPVREDGRPVKPRRNLESLGAGGGYASMTAKRLKDEIAARNDRRDADHQLPTTGNKAALVEVLEQDDAAEHTGHDSTPDSTETSDSATTGESDEAVTPTEGAADSTLITTKE